MDEKRLFIAISLPAPQMKRIAEAQVALRKHFPQSCIRWVQPQNIHLTLFFLGQVPIEKISQITSAMTFSAQNIKPINLEISDLGAFPYLNKPNVIWLGAKSDPQIFSLFDTLKDQLIRAKFSIESRPLSLHLTLARVSRNASNTERDQIAKTLAKINIASLGMSMVDSIQLYESDLRPTGPIYTRLASIEFGSSN